MEDNVLTDLRAQKIRVSSSSVLSTLSSPAKVAGWRAMGLPRDPFFAESAAIALTCTSWPLLIDPDGIGLQWLQAHCAAQDIDMLAASHQQADLVDVVLQCLAAGIPLAICGPLSSLRPELLSVVLRTFFVKKRATVVDVGGMCVEVHPDFRLFLCTGLSSSGFDPHLGHVCTMINFKLSAAGLQDSVLQVCLPAA
jgi:dynein heavy chain